MNFSNIINEDCPENEWTERFLPTTQADIDKTNAYFASIGFQFRTHASKPIFNRRSVAIRGAL